MLSFGRAQGISRLMVDGQTCLLQQMLDYTLPSAIHQRGRENTLINTPAATHGELYVLAPAAAMADSTVERQASPAGYKAPRN